jgi:hypothetical protein
MNRGDLRSLLFGLRSMNPGNTAAQARANTAINLALRRISGDAPEALHPATVHASLFGNRSSSASGYTLAVNPTDRYVLETTIPTVVDGVTVELWNTTGQWDGIFHIEAQDGIGRYRRRQCREFWKTVDGDNTTWRVSLDRPWHNATDTGMEWRLHQPYFFLPADIGKIYDLRIWEDGVEKIITASAAHAVTAGEVDYRGNHNGQPYQITREHYYQEPAPRWTPEVSISASDWTGNHPRVAARFKITTCWGTRSEEWRASASGGLGTNDPTFESGPSPASAVFDGTSNNKGIKITLPQRDFMLNFSDQDAVRATRSGRYHRIYVALSSVAASAGSAQSVSVPQIEADSCYYYLATVAGNLTEYNWTGTTHPDRTRPLPESHGYYAWNAYPPTDSYRELDIRAHRRPQLLEHDQDVVPIPPDVIDPFIECCLYYLCKQDEAETDAAAAEQRYLRGVAKLLSRYGSPVHSLEPRGWDVPGAYPATPSRRWRHGTFDD